MSTQVVSAATKLRRIRDSYIKQLPAQLESIRASYAKLVERRSDGSALEDLHRRIHTMRGSSASFGLSRLNAVAIVAENMAKEALHAKTSLDSEWLQQMQGHFSKMEHEIASIDPAHGVSAQVLELAAASESSSGHEKKTVYICEDDSFQRLTLATQISCFGFEVFSYGDLEQFKNAVRSSRPDIIVMDLLFPDSPFSGSKAMIEIQQECGTAIPTVFISSQNELSFRLSAVRAGSSAYFVKPVNISDLCSTLITLTTTVNPDPYRVLIVDDDPHLSELYASLLEEAGMVTLTLNEPLEAMTHLFEFQPDLILMDMYMPGCSGIELATAIRQNNAFFSIPIVFLSSEADIDKQFHALRTGGDEFLTKPIKPEHLINAVAVRAERMKIIRSFMTRDSMTGLFNHTTSKEQLDLAIAHALRQGTEVCFAMIDVDRFKSVNDTYGHPTGDRVLIALSRLLQQRLRKTDLVGRFGGEEFAVVLPDCDIATARSLLDQLRESFAAIHFPVGNEFFSSTFSCGIANLSRYGDAELICKAADEALYEAKNGGRNRVVVAGKQ